MNYMGTHWNFKCNTCGKECEQSFLRGYDLLLCIFRLIKPIKEIYNDEKNQFIEFTLNCDMDMESIRFIIEHDGHDIVVISEYGDIATENGIIEKCN